MNSPAMGSIIVMFVIFDVEQVVSVTSLRAWAHVHASPTPLPLPECNVAARSNLRERHPNSADWTARAVVSPAGCKADRQNGGTAKRRGLNLPGGILLSHSLILAGLCCRLTGDRIGRIVATFVFYTWGFASF